MIRSTLILVRHGHVEGISPERFRGRVDLPLTELGRKQIGLTARFIASQWSAKSIYSSPLTRCMDTANAIANEQHLQVERVEQLIDIDYGTWQGRSIEDVRAAEPEEFALWRKQPQFAVMNGGESLSDVQARVIRAFDKMRKDNQGSTFIVVSHDSVNRIFLTLSLGISLSAYWHLKQDPCTVNVLHFDDDGCQVECINGTAHLLETLKIVSSNVR